tara:strand:- start:500 stop:982 length:483 start_codon:yes stop_codon:yes gene_type:complete
MCNIATTRFNNVTFMENSRWREKNNWKGCIYPVPKQISNNFLLNELIFILEMNNDSNKIKGVGLIKNRISKKKYKIYSMQNYNRYIYKSIYRIDRKEMTHEEKKVLRILDFLVFKGKTHLKRGQGIIFIPKWIKNNNKINFVNLLKNLFNKKFNIFNSFS